MTFFYEKIAVYFTTPSKSLNGKDEHHIRHALPFPVSETEGSLAVPQASSGGLEKLY